MKYKIKLESNMGSVATITVIATNFENALKFVRKWKKENTKKYIDYNSCIIIYWEITEIVRSDK